MGLKEFLKRKFNVEFEIEKSDRTYSEFIPWGGILRRKKKTEDEEDDKK